MIFAHFEAENPEQILGLSTGTCPPEPAQSNFCLGESRLNFTDKRWQQSQHMSDFRKGRTFVLKRPLALWTWCSRPSLSFLNVWWGALSFRLCSQFFWNNPSAFYALVFIVHHRHMVAVVSNVSASSSSCQKHHGYTFSSSGPMMHHSYLKTASVTGCAKPCK